MTEFTPVEHNPFPEPHAMRTQKISASAPKINSLQKLKEALASNRGKPLFVRYSNGPKFDMKKGAVSKDYQTGEHHSGLSAVELHPDMSDAQLLRSIRDYNQAGKPHIYAGSITGVDSDNSPTIAPTKYLGAISGPLQNLLNDESAPHRMELSDLIKGLEGVKNPSPWQLKYLSEIRGNLNTLGGPVNHPGIGVATPALIPVDYDPFAGGQN